TLDPTGAVIVTLSAKVPAALVATPGTATVVTLSPASGAGNNGLSNALAFTINPAGSPVPTVSMISPDNAPANSSSVTLTITGTNFLPSTDPTGGSKVNFNLPAHQASLPITALNSTQITATIDSSLLVNSTGSAIVASVSVSNPPTPPPAS